MVVFFPNIFHTMSPSIMVDLVDRTSPFWSWRYHICFTVCLCTCLPIPCPCPVSIYLTLNGVILMSFTTTYTYFIVVLFPTISIVLFFYLDIFDVVVASAFFRVNFCIENFLVTISVEFLFLFFIVIACAKYCWWHQMSKDLLAKCIGIVCSAKQYMLPKIGINHHFNISWISVVLSDIFKQFLLSIKTRYFMAQYLCFVHEGVLASIASPSLVFPNDHFKRHLSHKASHRIQTTVWITVASINK